MQLSSLIDCKSTGWEWEPSKMMYEKAVIFFDWVSVDRIEVRSKMKVVNIAIFDRVSIDRTKVRSKMEIVNVAIFDHISSNR